MNRSAAFAAGLLVLVLCSASAPQPRHFVNDDSPLSFLGNSANLPVGGGVDQVTAIEWARGMPAVQQALDRCAARGYQRHVEFDAACASSSPPMTVVVLALEKPGLVNPAGLVGTPLVQVATVLDAAGNPRTQVSGGLVFIEQASGALRAAEDVSGFAGDATFDITPAGGGSETFHTDRVVQCLRDYTVCAGLGNSACVGGSLLPPSAWSVVRATVCVAARTAGCVYSFAQCTGW